MIGDEQAVRRLTQRWMEATARSDYAALEAMMHPEIVFLTPGRPPMNRDEFRVAFEKMMTAVKIEGTSFIRDLEVSGDLATTCSWIEVRVAPLSGAPPSERKGYALSVYRRGADGWLLWRDANLMID